MSIIFRWIFFSCLSRAVGTLIALLAIFSIVEVFDKARYLGHGMTGSLLAEYILLKMPFMVSEFMPVIMLIAVSIYITELSQHHEVVALRAAGLGMPTILPPVISVGIIGMLFGLAMAQWVTPHTNVRLDDMERTLIQHQPKVAQGIQWLKDGSRFFRLKPLGNDSFQLMMLKTDAKGRWLQRIDAQRAAYTQGAWHLHQVYISQPDATAGLTLKHRDKMLLASSITPKTAAPPSARQMTPIQLYTYGQNLKAAGMNSTTYIFTLHHMVASSVSCIIMVLLALSLCMNMGSRIAAASWGILTAITLGLLFYVFSNASGLLAHGGRMPAPYAAWLPLLFFGGITGFLMLHREGH